VAARRAQRSAIDDALEQHSAGASPGFLLWHATLRWQRAVAVALQDVGLTHVQFLVLSSSWWLAKTRGLPSQRDIAVHAGLDQVMTSQVVRALERDGLVQRTRDTADGRVLRVEVTTAGRGLARRSVAAMDSLDRSFFSECAPLENLLRQLRVLGARDIGGGATGDGDGSEAVDVRGGSDGRR
jgi:DNA-binding MarR family transcriptional regulator